MQAQNRMVLKLQLCIGAAMIWPTPTTFEENCDKSHLIPIARVGSNHLTGVDIMAEMI